MELTLAKGTDLVTGTVSGTAVASTDVECTLSTPGYDAIQGRSSELAVGGRSSTVAIAGHGALLEQATLQLVCTSSAASWVLANGNLEAQAATSLAD